MELKEPTTYEPLKMFDQQQQQQLTFSFCGTPNVNTGSVISLKL